MTETTGLQDTLNKLGYSVYEEIVEEFQHNVYSTVYTFTQNSQDAEDLSQEVFLLIYQNLPTFKFDSKLSTWIYRVTVNRCLMFKRKEQRRKNLAMFVPISKEMYEILPGRENVDRDVIKEEDKNFLYEALSGLNQKYTAVITLRYMQDLSIKGIGQILNLPPRTVETQLYRAKAKLKTNLESLGYKAEDMANG